MVEVEVRDVLNVCSCAEVCACVCTCMLCVRARARECVCVCMCVCVCVCVCLCVPVEAFRSVGCDIICTGRTFESEVSSLSIPHLQIPALTRALTGAT